MTTTQPAGTGGDQIEAWVRLPAGAVAATIDLLHRLDVFFREHADSMVHTQLARSAPRPAATRSAVRRLCSTSSGCAH